MRPIKEGDIVHVFYVDETQLLNVEVLHTPVASGDLWYFKDLKGDIYAQNPQSSNFDTIRKEANP